MIATEAPATRAQRHGEPSGGVSVAIRNAPTVSDRDIHLLRLSLDLQLDAMLMVLGAAAADAEAHTASAACPVEAATSSPPWSRWLAEDLDVTCSLTRTALNAHAALPSTLGGDPSKTSPDAVSDDLLARYESMCGLLTDLLARSAPSSPTWHAEVQRVLGRCEARVAELQQRRRLADAARTETCHIYLPGELLG